MITKNKKTVQRTAIANNIKRRHDHPTAEEIYESVKEQIPHISLGTVYRNLMILEKQGKIRVLSDGDMKHYDGDTKEHMHFLCTRCGRIFDIHFIPDEETFFSLARRHKLKPESLSVMINGYCTKCK